MIKLLIVEDTPVIRKYLEYIFESVPGFEVIGTAADGEEAIEFLKHRMPDVITMDIHMPRMDGFQTTRYIMETTPLPIIIVSGSTDPTEVAVTFKAVEAGAVGITLRPPGIGHPDHESEAKKLVELVRLMSEVKVVKRRPIENGTGIHPAPFTGSGDRVAVYGKIKNEIEIIAIGASTGGPPVIKYILETLPPKFGIPILVVQHIANGFTQGFVEWLNSSSELDVCMAVHGEPALPGRVYIAPDDMHMGIAPNGTLIMTKDSPEHGLRPSVSCLFRSVAESFGARAAGILLTGMGCDGAEELLHIRQRGGITIAQDAASSVVYGMPGEAIRLDAAMYVLTPETIVDTIVNLVFHSRGTKNG